MSAIKRRKTTLKEAVAFMRFMDAISDSTEGPGDDDLYRVNPGPSSSQSSSLSTALDVGHSVSNSKKSSPLVTPRTSAKQLPITGESHNC